MNPTIARRRNGDPRWHRHEDLATWLARELTPADRHAIVDRGTQRTRVLVDRSFKLFHLNWDGGRRFEPCSTAFAAVVRLAILKADTEPSAGEPIGSVPANEASVTPTGYFGGCPRCHTDDGHLNLGPDHWFVCNKHKTKWCIGSNLFRAWREETETQWRRNSERLADYESVEPYYGGQQFGLLVLRLKELTDDLRDLSAESLDADFRPAVIAAAQDCDAQLSELITRLDSAETPQGTEWPWPNPSVGELEKLRRLCARAAEAEDLPF